jgi:hypothetical protein
METSGYLHALEELPAGELNWCGDIGGLETSLRQIDLEHRSIEWALGVEESLDALFIWRNVPDDLQLAYEGAFTNSDVNLYDHYREMLARGEHATVGFVSNLKGKLAEIRLIPDLEAQFPGYTFELAESANQPVWDIWGTAPDAAEDIAVQVKVGGAGYVSAARRRMEDEPDTLFALGTEIRERIVSQWPELQRQVVDVDFSGLDLTADVETGLELLAANHGIDLPDGMGNFTPGVAELALFVRLVLDAKYVQSEFIEAKPGDQRRIFAIKALVLIPRWLVSGGLVSAGAIAGGVVVPGFGNIIGALGGALAATVSNGKLSPGVLRIAMQIVGITEDDLFYFRNRRAVDDLALRFVNTHTT